MTDFIRSVSSKFSSTMPPGTPTPSRPGTAQKTIRKSVGGKGVFGSGKTKAGQPKRHRKLIKDNIYAITKGDIRRMARRGGVKRISGQIYDEIRLALKAHLAMILKDVAEFVDYRGAKTVSVTDVIFALKRIGRPIYGFDQNNLYHAEKTKKRPAH